MAKWCQNRFNAYELRWFLVSLIVILLPARWDVGLKCAPAIAEATKLTLEGAVLGLSALMIAFTFAMVLSRFDSQPILKVVVMSP
jgi:F0F1-type ATP synthase assembly protein I